MITNSVNGKISLISCKDTARGYRIMTYRVRCKKYGNFENMLVTMPDKSAIPTHHLLAYLLQPLYLSRKEAIAKDKART